MRPPQTPRKEGLATHSPKSTEWFIVNKTCLKNCLYLLNKEQEDEECDATKMP